MNIAQKINKYLLQILLLIPLLFGGGTKELFEFPKTTAMYILGGIVLLLFLLHALGKKMTFKAPSVFVCLFVAANVLSSIFSAHRYTSFWGYYSRFNGGLITTLVLFGLYIVVSNNKELFKKAVTLVPILTVVPIAFYAIYQHYTGVARAYSTLGQPNWLAAYMVMLIPLILRRYIKGERKMLLIYLLAFASLWFTYSLSGLLGFLISGIFIYSQNKPIPKKKVVLLGALTLIIALTNQGIFTAKVGDLWLDVRKQLSVAREARAAQEYTISDPGFIRFAVWRGTLKLVVSNPKTFLIGTGPQTFPYEFQKHRPEELNYSSEWDFIINKPHNYYLELASEVGILGLLTYMLLLWQNRKSVFLPSMAGYAVTNFFGWPVVPTAILFWIWTAYTTENPKSIEIKTPAITKAIPLALICFLLYRATSAYVADVTFVRSVSKLKEGNLALALKYAKGALEKNPKEPNYYKQLARTYIASTTKASDEPTLKNLALDNMEKAYNLNPNNLATKRDVLSLYFYLASKDLTLPAGQENRDSVFLPITESYFSKLKNEYPTDAGTLVDIAKYEKRLNLDGYNETRSRVEKLRPDLITWHESFR